jgi:tRNA threonylcarbamoyladenosine modification (KEOPS) complex  Pcc1 subunit
VIYQNMSAQSATAIIKIVLKENVLRAVVTALGPEIAQNSFSRSKTNIKISNGDLVIETLASDTTALRASINSYLRWVDGIQNIVQNIE